jgi:hypothetical protein
MTDTPALTGYPVALTFDAPERIARWRPFLHWLLVIPHLFILYVIGVIAFVLAVIAWFSGVFLGRVSPGVLGPIAMTQRYSASVATYLLWLRPEYPPFAFDGSFPDPGYDPRLRVDVEPQLENRNRLTIFFRYFMVLPHAIVLAFVGIALSVVLVIGWFAVVILGRWPKGLEDFVIGVLRWNTRVNAYGYLLTDQYPPFSLS